MVALLTLTVFGLMAARLAGAPPGTWRWIVAATVALALLGQLLPPGNPYRISPAALRGAGWLLLLLVPVGAYALLLRRIRRRTGAGRAETPPQRPSGLVWVSPDDALAADTAAALAAEAGAATGSRRETLSLGWRTGAGELAGHLRLGVGAGVGDIEQLRVDPAHRRQAIGTRLVAAAAEAARRRGARRLVAEVASWQAPGFFLAQGFTRVAELPLGNGASRAWYVRELG